MNISDACEALNSGTCIELQYANKIRVVEVHAVGETKTGDPIMRAWQVSGDVGKNDSGWKLFKLNEAQSFRIMNEKSEAPRSGYRRGDPAIASIHCEV